MLDLEGQYRRFRPPSPLYEAAVGTAGLVSSGLAVARGLTQKPVKRPPDHYPPWPSKKPRNNSVTSQPPPPPPPPYRQNMFRRRYRRRRTRRPRRGARTRVMRRSSRTSINTFQRDASRQYSARGPSRASRRRQRRFVNRVNSVISAAQPLQIYTFGTVAYGEALKDTQSYYGVLLGDRAQLTDMFVQAYNVTTGTDEDYNRRLIVKNMCIDHQVTNSGSYPLILDVYHIVCRQSTKSAYSVAGLFTAGITALSDPAGIATGTAIAATQPELTLFENPMFCKHFKVKSKKEVLIAVGNTVTFQLRKPRNKEFEMQRVNAHFSFYPGYSEGYFFMWRGAPRYTGSAAEISASAVTIATQVTGHYGIPPTTLLREAGMKET